MHWIVLYANGNNGGAFDDVTYFDCLGLEHIQKETKKSMGNKNVITNNFTIQAYDSMCGYLCITFIDFMLKGKSLLDYANLFSPNE